MPPPTNLCYCGVGVCPVHLDPEESARLARDRWEHERAIRWAYFESQARQLKRAALEGDPQPIREEATTLLRLIRGELERVQMSLEWTLRTPSEEVLETSSYTPVADDPDFFIPELLDGSPSTLAAPEPAQAPTISPPGPSLWERVQGDDNLG